MNKNTIYIFAVMLFVLAGASLNAHAASPSSFGLAEGDLLSAEGDPDVYIVNEHGYKRLFLNPVIFNFYGHLGGFQNVNTVIPFARDTFRTTTYFQNCETGDPKVYAVEVTGEDTATLHWLNVAGDVAVAEDPNFFKKVFCINNNEFEWYALSAPYTSLSQAPEYKRDSSASMILPFELTSEYTASTKSQGDLSFAGSWVITPFAGTLTAGANPWDKGSNPDTVFELVPETVLRASISGTVTVSKNPVYDNGIDPQDWEIHIVPDGAGQHWVEYDHVVDVLVKTGDRVEIGQPLAKAAPASIRRGGVEGEKPVDEFEWGIRIVNSASTCPLRYLSEEDQNNLGKALETMSSLGFEAGESICLVEEF